MSTVAGVVIKWLSTQELGAKLYLVVGQDDGLPFVTLSCEEEPVARTVGVISGSRVTIRIRSWARAYEDAHQLADKLRRVLADVQAIEEEDISINGIQSTKGPDDSVAESGSGQYIFAVEHLYTAIVRRN